LETGSGGAGVCAGVRIVREFLGFRIKDRRTEACLHRDVE
jgi:hypothetical protein